MPFVLDDIIDKFWKDGRVKALEEFASRHDFEFSGRDRLDLQTYQIRDFNLFKGKKAKRLKGILAKSVDTVDVRIYDYIYYGEGEKRKTTVYEIFDEGLNLPRFLIRPKRIIKWVKEVFSKENWFYPDIPSFHAFYEIDGPYPEDIKTELSEAFVDLVSSATRLRVEGEGPYLLMYYRGRQTPVRDLDTTLDFVLDLWESLAGEEISDDEIV